MPRYKVTFFALARVQLRDSVEAESQQAALDLLASTVDFDRAIAAPILPDEVEAVTFAGGIDCAHVHIEGDEEGLFTRYYRPGPDGDWAVMQEPGDAGQDDEHAAA